MQQVDGQLVEGVVMAEVDDLYLPLVILWSPYQAYPSVFPPGSN